MSDSQINSFGGPRLVASSHPDGAAGVRVTDTSIVLTFDTAIAVDRYAVTVTDASGYMLRQEYGAGGVPGAKAVGNQLFIKPEGFFKPGSYTIELPNGSVTDLAGNAYAGPQRLTFDTVSALHTGTAGNDLLAGGRGAHIDGGAGIDTAQYAGFWGEYTIAKQGEAFTVSHGKAGAVDTLAGVERLLFEERAIALDIDGNGGQAYRLYRAAFDREPDHAGVGYWIGVLDRGASLDAVASAFLDSAEFQDLYGSALDDAQLVGQVYKNILHREPDQGGFDYWLGRLGEGMEREKLLASVSESAENVEATADLVACGFTYQPY